MDVEILHVPDCPNVDLLRRRLRVAMETTGVTADVRVTEVATRQDADRRGLHGSPTLLLDRDDPFAGPGVEASVSCRLFDVGGALERAPSVDQLIAALRSTQQDEPRA